MNYTPNRWLKRSVITVAAVLVLAATLALLWPQPVSSPGSPDDPETIAAGDMIYAAACASCHGVYLEGQSNWRQQLANGSLPAPPHDHTGHTWHHPDSVLFTITKHGGQSVAPPDFKSNMPGFEAMLTDEQIWAVLAYIKSTWPTDVREHQRRISKQSSS